VQFSISKDTHELLQQAKALLSHAVPKGDMDQVFQRALEALISQLEKQKFGGKNGRPGGGSRLGASSGSKRPHIPANVRRAVWERDERQCTFVGAGGHRCTSRTLLELDHIRPLAQGGAATVDNLRLRCRAHNQYEAERIFGAGFMSQKRDEARARRGQSGKARGRSGRSIQGGFVREPVGSYRVRRRLSNRPRRQGDRPRTPGLSAARKRVRRRVSDRPQTPGRSAVPKRDPRALTKSASRRHRNRSDIPGARLPCTQRAHGPARLARSRA